MIAELKPYPEYKDSKLPWLGKIPKHWDEKRAKCYFREVNERSKTGNEELLSVSHITGVTPRSQKNITMFKAESYTGYKLCKPGDLAINTMWAWMGALGVSKYSGIISSGYAVYRPIHSDGHIPEFIDSLLRTPPYTSEYYCRSTGVRSSRFRLYPESFLKIPIICPPFEEQEKIMTYLRTEDRKISHYIRVKRQQIDLLNEQKQTIISRAIMNGIDPNVRLKPSGFDWLGDVPVHWDILKLKRVCKRWALYGANLSSDAYRSNGIRFIRTNDITDDGKLNHNGGVYVNERTVIDYLLEDGDLLFSRSGTLGRSFIYRSNLFGPCSYAAYLVRFVLNSKMLPEYAYYFSKTKNFEQWLNENAIYTTIGNVNGQKYANMEIPVPNIEEQKQILLAINSESYHLDQIISSAHKEIDLIKEYQASIVSDIITGTVDVREIIIEEIPVTESNGVGEEFSDTYFIDPENVDQIME